MLPQLLTACLLLTSLCGFGQADTSLYLDKRDIRYTPVTENYFKGHEKATLIVDYYHTRGYSNRDRYVYEVIVVDSLVMLAFSAPGSDDFKYISYQKKYLLTTDQVDTLKSVLTNARLRQLTNGIPEPVASAHTKEVLLIKYQNIRIEGGLFHHEIFSEEDVADTDKEIAAQRRLTSSIGGDYDLVIGYLKTFFPDLDRLLQEVQKEE